MTGPEDPSIANKMERTGFKTIETVGRLVLFIILRFWRFCTAAMLTLLLLYWLYGGVVIFLLLMAAVLGALYHYQDSFLYFPEQPLSSRVFVQNARVLGLPYENLYLRTQDGVRINAVFIKQPPRFQPQAPTVLFFHGNAGNVGHRLLNTKALHAHCYCNVLLVEYRGYGKSEGSPSEYAHFTLSQCALQPMEDFFRMHMKAPTAAKQIVFDSLEDIEPYKNVAKASKRSSVFELRGITKHLMTGPTRISFMLDAQAAMDHLLNRPDIDTNQIIIFGRSLGGAVAIDLASQPLYLNRAFALIVENTFTSIPAMASELLTGLHRLPYFCFRNKFDSLAKINSSRAPTLFLSGLADQLIPPKMMKLLYQTSGSTLKRLETFDGGSHNDTWQCMGYLDAISNFIHEVQQAHITGMIAAPAATETNTTNSTVLTMHKGGITQDI